jgi:transaldolase / glucose-6-phosphate isomerase
MQDLTPVELVERIWERDPSVWTGGDEASWLGWLDEPLRMLERVDDLLEFASTVEYDTAVLLGMGGSSLAPEVMRRLFQVQTFHVLDTTHPTAIRRLEERLDLDRTLFVVSSKSGSTLETRSHADYFFERAGRNGERFVAVTDPGSELESLASERGFYDVFPGEPTIGGRYSALSMFGIVPATLMGLDILRLLERAEEMREACRLADGNPGLELGTAMGEGWRYGRDKVLVAPNTGGFGLWVEQLLAESTGKDDKGLVPLLIESEGDDLQRHEARLPDPYELGQEFFRWEFATAVAGSILEINPFDQPDVQAAKDKTNEVLRAGDAPIEPEGSLDEALESAKAGQDYIAILAFIDPDREAELEPLVERARATGCAVTAGLGPRYLHSTGQLHKGGPNRGVFVHVVDDLGEELAIPGRDFGFRRLIAAQAVGDYQALKERGRRIVRLRLEEVAR